MKIEREKVYEVFMTNSKNKASRPYYTKNPRRAVKAAIEMMRRFNKAQYIYVYTDPMGVCSPKNAIADVCVSYTSIKEDVIRILTEEV